MPKLFDFLGGGSKSKSVDLNPGTVFKPFDIGGVTGKIDSSGAINIGANAGRNDLVSGLSGTFQKQSDELKSFLPGLGSTFSNYSGTIRSDLLPKVASGFGALSSATASAYSAARERLKSSRQATTGNLKDDLARRNISGSSFAQDTATRAAAEFDALDRDLAAAEGQAMSQAALEELNATSQLIDKAFQAEVDGITSRIGLLDKAFQAEAQSKSIPLEDMNNILTIGSGILNNAMTQFGANARAEADLAAKAAAGQGKFASQIGSLIGGGVGFLAGGPAGASIGSGLGSVLTTR